MHKPFTYHTLPMIPQDEIEFYLKLLGQGQRRVLQKLKDDVHVDLELRIFKRRTQKPWQRKPRKQRNAKIDARVVKLDEDYNVIPNAPSITTSPIIMRCPVCNDPIENPTSRTKACPRCRHLKAAGRVHKVRSRKEIRETRNSLGGWKKCENPDCNKEFRIRRKDQRHCDTKCANRPWRTSPRPLDVEMVFDHAKQRMVPPPIGVDVREMTQKTAEIAEWHAELTKLAWKIKWYEANGKGGDPGYLETLELHVWLSDPARGLSRFKEYKLAARDRQPQ